MNHKVKPYGTTPQHESNLWFSLYWERKLRSSPYMRDDLSPNCYTKTLPQIVYVSIR